MIDAWLAQLARGEYEVIQGERERSWIAQLRRGPRLIASYLVTPKPGVLDDLGRLDGPMLAPYLGAVHLPPYGTCVIELEPPGAPIERALPLPVADAVAIAADVAGVLVDVHGRGLTLWGAFVDPELVYVERGRLAGIAPRGPVARVRAARDFRGNYNPPLPPPVHLFAPEMVAGRDDGGAAADVFGLCACLHWWITGDSLYGPDHDGVVALIQALIRGDRVRDLALPPSLAAIVEAGTARDPAARPTAADLVARLRST